VTATATFRNNSTDLSSRMLLLGAGQSHDAAGRGTAGISEVGDVVRFLRRSRRAKAPREKVHHDGMRLTLASVSQLASVSIETRQRPWSTFHDRSRRITPTIEGADRSPLRRCHVRIQKPSGSCTKMAVMRPEATALLITSRLFTPLGTP
jgi:hypothetical protein